MAIGFARVEFVKRSSGKNSCQKSAYNGRARIEFEGNKYLPADVYDWSSKDKTAFSTILLPEHASKELRDPQMLWNLVEKTETRKNSQVALEMVVALPDDAVVSLDDRIHLIQSFIQQNFVDKGLGAQIDIHKPDVKVEYSSKSDELVRTEHNWHAHVLLTTRRFDDTGRKFETHKPRELMPQVRNGFVVEGEKWGRLWTQHQNLYFEEKGMDLRVDFNGVIPQQHLGPVRMRGRAFALLEEQNSRSELNTIESEDPGKILRVLTIHSSTFTREEVDKFIDKWVLSESVKQVKESFWKHDELVPLVDKETHEPTDRYTASFVVEEEQQIMRLADRIAKRSALLIKDGQYSSKLTPEQSRAFDHITKSSGLGLIEGHAGTGKSHLLFALKNAYTDNGYTVRAFGPDNATSKVLEEKGFTDSENIYRFLFALHNKRRHVSRGKEVWVIDEAGKLGNRPLLEILKAAERDRIQVVLSGCSSQLPSVDRGGVFAVLCAQFGAATLEDIQRQRRESQRDMARKLASGDIGAALNSLADTGGIRWSRDRKGALEDLIQRWSSDKAAYPGSSSIMIALSNKEVRVLNELARLIKRERGELQPEEYSCETTRGKIYVSVGDRIEFRRNDKNLGVINGQSGLLVEAKEDCFVVAVEDSGIKRKVSFNPQEYSNYQLGYATTYFRSQGRTVDRAYVLYSRRMSKEAFYVGLTRHVENAYIFIPRSTAKNLSDVKHHLQQSSLSPSSLHFTTNEQVDAVRIRTLREASLQELKASVSIRSKLTGYGLSFVDSMISKGRDLTSRISDRTADQKFYKPDFGPETQSVRVERVIDEAKDPEDYLSGLDLNDIAKRAASLNRTPPQVEEPNVTKPASIRADHRAVVGSYSEKSESARNLHAVVQAESESRGGQLKDAPNFVNWQMACGERNEAAYVLRKQAGSELVSEYFGKRSAKVILDQADRYEAQSTRKENLDQRLQQDAEVVLHRLFPDGPTSRAGRSLRFGRKGSLSVTVQGEKAGSFYDFERSEGGGMLKLIERETGLSTTEARKWAEDLLGGSNPRVPSSFAVSSKATVSQSDWIARPASAEAPKFADVASRGLASKYQETARYAYRDSDGNLLYYTLRLEDRSGGKVVLPLSYGNWKEQGGDPHWQLKGYASTNRTLFNQQLLKEHPQAKVLIVEGEKTANAAMSRLAGENLIVLSWPGGAGAVSKTDWSPLFMRQVLMWPDNDQAGFKAAEAVCQELRKVGVRSLRVVSQEQLRDKLPEKWDLADELPSGMTSSWIKQTLSAAEERACDPREVLVQLRAYGVKTDPNDPTHLSGANELLWRVDNRLRAGSDKPQQAIVGETARLMAVSSIAFSRGSLTADQRVSRNELYYRAEYGESAPESLSRQWRSEGRDVAATNPAARREVPMQVLIDQQKFMGRSISG